MEQAQPVQPLPQQVTKKPWWKRTGPSLAVAGAVLVVMSGFVHCVHGGDITTLCWKDGWALSDTFVDPTDYIGRSRIELLDKLKVVRALEKCGVIEVGGHR